jgi:hypothetical protein
MRHPEKARSREPPGHRDAGQRCRCEPRDRPALGAHIRPAFREIRRRPPCAEGQWTQTKCIFRSVERSTGPRGHIWFRCEYPALTLAPDGRDLAVSDQQPRKLRDRSFYLSRDRLSHSIKQTELRSGRMLRDRCLCTVGAVRSSRPSSGRAGTSHTSAECLAEKRQLDRSRLSFRKAEWPSAEVVSRQA